MTKPKTARQTKTPRQRAEEALGVADRKVAHLTKKWNKAKADAEQLGRERDEAIRRFEYVRQDPALAEGTNPPAKSGDTA